jgi:hypothetical protein
MAERRFGRSQVVATLLALIMLVSVGGTAFVGAAAGQTGGTFDQVTPVDDENVSSDLNLTGPDDGAANLVGADSGGSAQGVDIADDGQVNITNPDSNQDTFTGITLTPDRIASTTSAQSDNVSSGDLADFLDDVPNEYNVSTNKSAGDAIPAVFIEFDPQSEFSQINNTNIPNNRTNGTHDFIVVAPANASNNQLGGDDQLNGTVDTNLNASQNSQIAENDIVALSVDNDNVPNASSSLLASESNFGTVFDTLVGTSETDLQNKNIDRVEFGAGTFDGTAVAIDEVEFADDIGTDFFSGQTIHSEKITLQNETTSSNTTFFDSVSDAVNASSDGDTIFLDRGNYSELETSGESFVNVSQDVTITTGDPQRVNEGASVERVNTTAAGLGLNDSSNEAVIDVAVNISADATLENIVVNNGSNPAINVTASDATLNNVIVNYTATDTAVKTTNSDLTVADSTLLANDPVKFETDVGLNLSDQDNGTIANNHFIGFETQVGNITDSTNATDIFRANEDEFTGTVPAHPNSPNVSQYADRDVAQSAVPFNGNSVRGTDIFGAINASDKVAQDGDVINVSGGTYDNGSEVAVSTDDIEVVGAGDSTLIEQAVSLNGSTTVSFTDAKVNGTATGTTVTAINASQSSDVDLTVENINVSADAGNISVGAAANISIRDVEFVNATEDAVNITASPADNEGIVVTDTTVNNLTAGVGVNIDDASADTIDISNVDINGNASPSGQMDGVNISQAGTSGSSDTLDVVDNDITGIGNGTALTLNETASEAPNKVIIDNNNLRGDTRFVGIEYNLDDATGTNFTSNVIVGSDVAGGSNSIGIDFVNVTVSDSEAEGITGTPEVTDANTVTVEDNVITGHARVINVRDSEWNAGSSSASGDYQNILTSSTTTGNNSIGTVINGTAGQTYADAYGNDTQLENNNQVPGTTLHYLPGSVNESLNLVRDGPFNQSELLIEDPEITVANTNVDKYNDDTIVAPNLDGVDLQGEDSDIEVESRIVINKSDRLNNYTFTDFTLNNTDSSNPAINLTDGHNSQSTFDNLDITSQGDGVVVNANETDVNVIEVLNSDITIEASGSGDQGILLADDTGDVDDRDGFVIFNNDISGPGIDVTGSTGLNMTDVDKPGKELDTQLNVSENFITGFERQVEVTDPAPTTGTNVTALNFTSEQFDNQFDISNNTDPSLTIDENEFGQQVLVFNTSAINRSLGQFNSDPDRVNDNQDYGNLSLNDSDVFGSIDAATEQAGANDTVRVYATTSDADNEPNYDNPSEVVSGVTEYSEAVDVGKSNVTIRGPSFQSAGTDALQGPDALINGTVEFDGAGESRVLFTGFTVVADDSAGSVVNVTGSASDRSGNITIENTSVSAFGNSTTGLPEEQITGIDIADSSGATPGNSTNITNVFVGDHQSAQTINSSLIVSNTTQLTVEDSEFNANTGTDDGVGVNLTNTSASSTIDNTIIAEHAEEGVNVTGANATVNITGSSTIENNGGSGVVSTNENEVTFDLIIEDDTTVNNNSADGLNLNDGNISLTLTQSEVVDHTNSSGVLLQNVSNDTVINRTTIESNGIGLDVTGINNDSNTTVVRNNAFDANANFSISNSGVNKLNASLNHFSSVTDIDSKINDSNGGVTIYDPFLTEDQTEQIDDPGIDPDDADSASVTSSTEIGHDVVAPADSIITVGFPARPASNADTVGEAFDFDKIDSDPDLALYKFQKSGFGTASFTFNNIEASDEIEFRDAFVVVNNGTTAESAGTVTYIDSREVPGAVATQQFSAGVNFVAPVGAGNVSEVLVGGGDNDLVQSGTFTSEANQYGVADVTNTSFGATFPNVRSNFRNGVGTVNVHPHRGYFVIAQNGSAADGQLFAEEVTVGGAPTAGNIDQKLNQTAD